MYRRPSPEPASAEELAFYTAERKIRHAVKMGLPWGAEQKMADPALRKKLRPVYRCPECPDCKRTVRHYGRCSLIGEFDLKPTKTWELQGADHDHET